MKIIKLNTTPSTNTFLKDLAQLSTLEDFTIVTAKKQTSGRGQMNSKWISDECKNLTFSVFCKFLDLKTTEQRYLNFAVSLSVFEFLTPLNLPKLAIKWPNDILSDKKKICGILIENSLQKNTINSSIIGIGLNVNQEKFPKNVKKATSIKIILQQNFDLDELLNKFLKILKSYIDLLRQKKYSELETQYLNALYMKGVPTMFKTNNKIFMGKILGISTDGKLQIELEDESIKEFGIKEVEFVL